MKMRKIAAVCVKLWLLAQKTRINDRAHTPPSSPDI